MTDSSSPHDAVWSPRRYAASVHTFAPGLAFVLAVIDEFKRAGAATHRYERLKHSTRDNRAVDAARQIFVEFYSDD